MDMPWSFPASLLELPAAVALELPALSWPSACPGSWRPLAECLDALVPGRLA